MTTHDELRNDVAEAVSEVVLDALRRLNPEAGDEGVDEFTDDEYDALVSAVVQGLAEGAYQRAMVAQGSPPPQMNDAHNRVVTRNVIAATLGLDPTDVPT